MTQKTITCNSVIEAEGLRARLMEEGIESVKYDETNSKMARGVFDLSIDVMVREEDYDKAKLIYDRYLTEQESFMPWCPECGSENLEKIVNEKYKSGKIVSLLASVISCTAIGNGLASTKYRCKNCGKVFERQE